MVVFEDHEVMFDCDLVTGKLKISISIKTILKKLPKNMSKTVQISQPVSQEEIEKEYFPKLSGITFKKWLLMNFEINKTGRRSIRMYENLLSNLVELCQKYGVYQLNEAISKCYTPERCTIPYLKAILRNQNNYQQKEGAVRDGKYQNKIEKALNRFV